MQSRRWMAVWLGVGVSSACTVPIDPADQAGAASRELAAADEPDVVLAAALGQLAQRAYIKASNTDLNDYFGDSIALSADGSTLAVGARNEDSAATGIGGDQADDSAENAGAVYVFTRRGKTWRQQAYLKASNPDAFDDFGYSIALSADGSTLAVGAIGEDGAAPGIDGDQADDSAEYAGAVYVFTRRGKKWSQQAYVKASSPGAGDYFGYSVALSGDGSTLAVGAVEGGTLYAAPGTGAAYVFTRHATTWSQAAHVTASNADLRDAFGYTIALSADGSTLAVGAIGEASAATGVGGDQADNSAFQAGAVYVLARSGAAWSQQAYVKASNTDPGDVFGISVALSADGSTLAVGAQSEASAATGVGGDQTDDSALHAGAAYVLARSGTTWSQEAYLKASNTDASDLFGVRLALSADGSALAVGAMGEASAATGVGGDQADDSAPFAGAVYMFTRSGLAWSQQAYVKASNTDAGDGDIFGFSLALSADASTLAVGAIGEASAATGINGDQTDESAPSAGAVYVLDRRR